MRRHTFLRTCFNSLFLLAANVECAPELAFPVNAQVPPVAYASEPYTYTFADTTFRSDGSPLSYTLKDAPKWLSLDQNTRTLKGSPAQSDVGSATFQLGASDDTGSTSTSVTLVVSDQQTLKTGEPVTASLRGAGQVQEPSTLFLSPLAPFTITFSQNIFSGGSSSTVYYAVSGDSSPLPPWIQFDAQSLRLSGTTPATVDSSLQNQSYRFRLIASDVPGFSEASIAFDITIASRIFFFQSDSVTINVTEGQRFRSEAFRNILYLGGNAINPADLESVQADLPEWVTLDPKSIVLSGTAPADLSPQSFTITARDRFNDEATLPVTIQADATNSPGNAINITAYPGQYLDFTIPLSLTQNVDQVTATIADSAGWLMFSTNNMTLHGQVPKDASSGSFEVSLLVTENGSQTTYPINVIIDRANEPSRSITSSSIVTSTSSSEPAAGTGSSNAADQNPNTQPRHILAIVLTSVLTVLAVLAIILFCLCWRKRKNKKLREKGDPSDDHAASTSGGGSPEMREEPPVGHASADTAVAPGPSKRSSGREKLQTPIRTPRIDSLWAPDSIKKARMRFSRKQKERPEPHDSLDSNWNTPHGYPPKSPALTTAPASANIRSNTGDGPSQAPAYLQGRRRSEADRKQSERLAQIQRHRLGKEPLPTAPPRRLSSVSKPAGPTSADLIPIPVDKPVPAPPSSQGRRRSEADRKQSERLAQIQRQRLNREPLGNGPTRALSIGSNYSSSLPNRLSAAAGVGHGSVILSPTSPNAEVPWRSSRLLTQSSWSTTLGSATGKENRRPSMATMNLESFPVPPSSAENGPDPNVTFSSLAGLTGPTPALRLVSASPAGSDTPSVPRDDDSFSSRLQQYHTERSRADTEQFDHFSNASLRTPSLSKFIPGTKGFRAPSSNYGQGQSGAGAFPIYEEDGPGPSTFTVPSSPPRPQTRGDPSRNWSRLPLNSDPSSAAGPSTQPLILSPVPHRPPPARIGLARAISASSGQFSSALSSSADSQWEDYMPHIKSPRQTRSPPPTGGDWGYAYAYSGMSVHDATDEMLYELEVGERGERQWTTTSSSAANSAVASPRLPFSGGVETTGDEGETELGTESEGFVIRAADRTPKRGSVVGEGGLRLVDKRQRVVSVDGKAASESSGKSGGGEGQSADVKGKGRALAWGGRERSRRGSLRFI